MLSLFGVFVLGWISSAGCFPSPEENPRSIDTSFIGKGTSDLASALLQGYVTKEENQVYSPFGYSAILAVFSEGARGVSREEIATALHFPSDVAVVREAYRSVLEKVSEGRFQNSPEFKNWFYIYRNYTVEEELQNILRKYYLTEVKCVKRPEDYISGTKKTPMMASEQKTEMETPKVQHGEKPKNEESVEKAVKSQVDEGAATPKVVEKSSVPAEGESVVAENSKYKGEENIGKLEKAETEKKMAVGEGMTKKEEEKMAAVMGSKWAEHLSGSTDSSLSIRGKDPTQRMVIFNGLYYKGRWETPFEKKPADDSRPFYKSETEKVFVSSIHSQGVFNYGDIPNLDSKAIELPYKGGRYSLLLVVPNSRNGLKKLITDISGYPLRKVYDQLGEKLVEVCLPSFEINTISKPVSSPRELGMTINLTKIKSIFDPETADLSGISSKDSGLFVDELVQVVTFKVDAESSKTNFLTASIASSRSNVQNFQINRPFLFYLRDNLDDLIIVNGKVIDPTPKSSFYFS